MYPYQGLKKSGKTTVTEAVIASLLARGFRVGSIKSTHRARFDLDLVGSDTERHSRAGARIVIAGSEKETIRLERHRGRKAFKELAELFPADIQFVICEGSIAPEISTYVLCLESIDRLEETLSLRKIPGKQVIALSGMAASGRYLGPPWPQRHVGLHASGRYLGPPWP